MLLCLLPRTLDLQGTLLGLLNACGAELSILQSANRVVAAGKAAGGCVGRLLVGLFLLSCSAWLS